MANNLQLREYCVQYGETDFDFIRRVLAEEGIAFYFDHQAAATSAAGSSAGSLLTLIDDTTIRSSAFGPAVPFVSPSAALEATGPHVQRVLVSSGIETSETTVRDYDFERPGFNLEGHAVMGDPLYGGEASLEAFSYAVGSIDANSAAGAAAVRLEAARTGRDSFELDASFQLAPGSYLTILNHPHEHVNGEMLVTAMRARVSVGKGGDALSSHVLDTIPAAVRYRPPRLPKPRIHGTQTAFVVGKKLDQDEIDVDKWGRVKVRFVWDRRPTSVEGKPTRYIRVSQGWAGQGYGLVLLPRVGDELIVAYQDGDPDEPIVVGRAHNAVYPSPLNLPSSDDVTVSIWKSKSSPAEKGSTEDRFNMVRMQDRAGGEMLELRAQRDFHNRTLRDSSTEVGHDQTISVKGNQSTGAGSISMSSGSTISMDAQQSISGHAHTDIKLGADGDIEEKAGVHMKLEAGTEIKAESDQILINGKIKTSVHGGVFVFVHSGANTTVSSNASVYVEAGAVVRIEAPAIHIEGAAISITGGTVDISGSEVNASGGTVNVDGDASVNIKGGLVNLNC